MRCLKLGQSLCSSNAPTPDTFQNLYSLDFDGVDDYVSIDGVGSEIDPDLGTFSVWAKIGATGGSQVFLLAMSSGGADNQLNLFYHSGVSEVRFVWRGSATSTVAASGIDIENDGLWHHIAATWNTTSNEAKIYIDSVLKDTETITTSFVGAINQVDIAQSTADTAFLKGNIDEVSIFDSEKSSGDITSIYNSGCPTDLSSASNLVGYWRNGDTTGTSSYPTITDDSSNSNNGTMTNMVLTDIIPETPCQTFSNLYSLDFDGVDDFVSIDGVSSEIDPDLGTYSAWVKVDAGEATSVILMARTANSDNQILLLNSPAYDELQMSWRGAATSITAESGTDIAGDGLWHHVAGTWSTTSNEVKIYVDGVLKDTTTITVSFSGTIDKVDIGQNTADAAFFGGNIDEVSIFDSVKSDADITSIYNSGTPTDLSGESGLVGYWRNGDIQGTSSYPSLHDFSENSNLGTMTNMASGDIVTDVP